MLPNVNVSEHPDEMKMVSHPELHVMGNKKRG